jgi:phytoene synthase
MKLSRMAMLSQRIPSVSDADHAFCRRQIRVGSRTFAAASLLLPSALRQAAIALYGFCRLSDDLVDVEGGAMAAVTDLRHRLELAYRGTPKDCSTDRAFAEVVIRYGVPRALPEALIDGLQWDVGGVRCDSLSDLFTYATCVAGSVGAMMTVLMGVHDAARAARACDLGIAMQLTNIARDVGEDARAGRLYLPRDWLRQEGIDGDVWLQAPRFDAAIGRVIARLLVVADQLYRRADAGVSALPAACRPGIFAASHLYREIGVEVARRGFDSVAARARVPGRRKVRLVGRAVVDAVWRSATLLGEPPLPQAAHLVAAVTAPRRQSPGEAEIERLGRLGHRILWVAELFASLDARQQRMSGERA